jgi:hypothetical protein
MGRDAAIASFAAPKKFFIQATSRPLKIEAGELNGIGISVTS